MSSKNPSDGGYEVPAFWGSNDYPSYICIGGENVRYVRITDMVELLTQLGYTVSKTTEE